MNINSLYSQDILPNISKAIEPQIEFVSSLWILRNI